MLRTCSHAIYPLNNLFILLHKVYEVIKLLQSMQNHNNSLFYYTKCISVLQFQMLSFFELLKKWQRHH